MSDASESAALRLFSFHSNGRMIILDFDDTLAVTEYYKGFPYESILTKDGHHRAYHTLFGSNSRQRCLFNLLQTAKQRRIPIVVYTHNPYLGDIVNLFSAWYDEFVDLIRRNYAYQACKLQSIRIQHGLHHESDIYVINQHTLYGGNRQAKALFVNACAQFFQGVVFVDDQHQNLTGVEESVVVIRSPIGGMLRGQIDSLTHWIQRNASDFSLYKYGGAD